MSKAGNLLVFRREHIFDFINHSPRRYDGKFAGNDLVIQEFKDRSGCMKILIDTGTRLIVAGKKSKDDVCQENSDEEAECWYACFGNGCELQLELFDFWTVLLQSGANDDGK